MRIIICGGRSFSNYDLLCKVMDKLTARLDDVVILSGHAEGADRLGERYAYDQWFPYEIYHADWKANGKSAGQIRNTEMVKACGKGGGLVAFFNNSKEDTPGTSDVVAKARKAGLRVKVVRG